MKVYKKTAHVVAPISDAKGFEEAVRETMGTFQREGLQVEIQYQQSIAGYSAFVLGYEEKG
ncbi:hypothetical protein [Brevibacillus centrosporus]|uniref:hypothetical protein n=1 Tax=Brevibacillus centrosporus TaxID=54910 RepID=UPI002E1DA9D2|nr:hypothetical protein [Brevibacillus centrosporus]